MEKLLEILRSAGERRALVVYTLVEPNMSQVARTACNVMQVGSQIAWALPSVHSPPYLWASIPCSDRCSEFLPGARKRLPSVRFLVPHQQIPHVDMLGPLLSSVEEHLGVSAQRLPRGSKGRKNKLSKEYFRRIEAVDFTIK